MCENISPGTSIVQTAAREAAPDQGRGCGGTTLGEVDWMVLKYP